jgi:endonuclease/exonuclease/phosphatase family metal-dependent hydrolase
LTKSKWYTRPVYVVVALVLVLGLTLIPTVTDAGLRSAQPVRVMTQNLYVGSDIFKVMEANFSDPLGVPIAVAGIFQDVVNTSFPERAEAIADEIELYSPHLIGLQEVSWIRTQSPGDFLIGNPTPATDTVYNYLEILLDALSDRGLDYEVAAVVEEADVELPMLVGFDANYTPLLDDARLTDRDVILKRSDVTTSNVFTYNYENIMTYEAGGVAVEFVRGFAAVDATVDGNTYRFVNTHLEVQGADISPEVPYIQALQAYELTEALKGETLPIILVGDFNSGRKDTSLLPISDPPYFLRSPYWQIRLAGYADTWLRRLNNRRDPGYTCCQDADLLNEESSLTERIDIVFVRNKLRFSRISRVGPVFSWVVGDEPEDKTLSGLWPSDHAGVVARLKIPVA